MDQEKRILRTHGGAVRYNQPAMEDLPLDVRQQMHQNEKELVAEAAVQLIHEGTTIYIGAGTTGHALASKLGTFHHLTVLTNDIDVAHEIALTDNSLIVAGGQLKPHSRTLYGLFRRADATGAQRGYRLYDRGRGGFGQRLYGLQCGRG